MKHRTNIKSISSSAPANSFLSYANGLLNITLSHIGFILVFILNLTTVNSFAGNRSSSPQLVFLTGSPGLEKITFIKKLNEKQILNYDNFVFMTENNKNEYPLEDALRRHSNIILDLSLSNESTARSIVETVKQKFTNYTTTLVNIRTPYLELVKNNHRQSKIAQSLINSDINIDNLFHENRRIARALDPYFDSVIYISNDQSPKITYLRNGHNFKILNINWDSLRKLNKDSLHLSKNNSKESILDHRPIDIVLDLDWTLLYAIKQEQYIPHNPDFLMFDNQYYRLSDGVREFVQTLLKDPRVRISIYSGSKTDRLDYILSHTKLNDGRSLFEATFQVLSFPDLKEYSEVKPNARFSERYFKDLKAVVEGISLDRALLLEDIRKFVPPSQEKNVIWLQNTYKYRDPLKESFSPKTLTSELHTPENAFVEALERNKLAWSLGVITESIKKSDTSGMTLQQAYNQILYNRNGELIDREKNDQIELYEKGLSLMSKVNPHFFHLLLPNFYSTQLCIGLFKLH